MSTASATVRSPADDEAPDDLEWLHVTPSDYGEVTVEEPTDGQPRITVPISSTTPHRSDGKIMTEEALEDMAEQLASGKVGLWDDHGLSPLTGWREYRREEMYGKWVEGEVDDQGFLWGTAELMTGRGQTQTLLEQLDQDMPVGFSVGYKPLEEEMLATGDDEEGDKTRHIFDVDLWETSPVGIPDNPEAIAQVAAELDRANVDIGPELASTIASSVREGLETASMTDTPDDDSTDSGETPDGGADAGTTSGAETRELDSEQVDEVMAVVEGVFAAAEDAIRSELAENDDDDEDEDDEDDESAGFDVDVTREGDHVDDDDDDDDDEESTGADVEDLVERLDALEERNQELEKRLEEKEATIDRLESETRESAGRKGISPSAGSGPDGDGDGEEAGAGDEADASTSNRPRNALDEAQRLGGD